MKMISLPENVAVDSLNEFDNEDATQYTYDDYSGDGSYIYVLDCGFDFDHPPSITLMCNFPG